jgi:hypothetical protein
MGHTIKQHAENGAAKLSPPVLFPPSLSNSGGIQPRGCQLGGLRRRPIRQKI